MKCKLVLLVLALSALVACGTPSVPSAGEVRTTAEAAVGSVATAVAPTASQAPAPTDAPTETPAPTDAPTETPVPPTETPVPTAVPTETPAPTDVPAPVITPIPTTDHPVFDELPDTVILRGAVVGIVSNGQLAAEKTIPVGYSFKLYDGPWYRDYPDFNIKRGQSTLGVDFDRAGSSGGEIGVLVPKLSDTELGKAANAVLLDATLWIMSADPNNQPIKPNDLMEVVLSGPASTELPYTVNFYRGEGAARQLVATFTINKK